MFSSRRENIELSREPRHAKCKLLEYLFDYVLPNPLPTT